MIINFDDMSDLIWTLVIRNLMMHSDDPKHPKGTDEKINLSPGQKRNLTYFLKFKTFYSSHKDKQSIFRLAKFYYLNLIIKVISIFTTLVYFKRAM